MAMPKLYTKMNTSHSVQNKVMNTEVADPNILCKVSEYRTVRSVCKLLAALDMRKIRKCEALMPCVKAATVEATKMTISRKFQKQPRPKKNHERVPRNCTTISTPSHTRKTRWQIKSPKCCAARASVVGTPVTFANARSTAMSVSIATAMALAIVNATPIALKQRLWHNMWNKEPGSGSPMKARTARTAPDPAASRASSGADSASSSFARASGSSVTPNFSQISGPEAQEPVVPRDSADGFRCCLSEVSAEQRSVRPPETMVMRRFLGDCAALALPATDGSASWATPPSDAGDMSSMRDLDAAPREGKW
mmetsp:Transcript_93284/g.260806  ORF Transcript_93284/g.260806 Transcript_93284/m.260806 type:complete len:309 (+) Transcript_93284:659-1585(+)